MNKKIFLSFCLLLAGYIAPAQQPATKALRLVDSLPAKESAEQYRLLFRSELDSLIRLYAPVQTPVQVPVESSARDNSSGVYLFLAIAVLLIITVWVLLLLFRQRKELLLLSAKISRQQSSTVKLRNGRKPGVNLSPEEKIMELNEELHKLSKENEGLNRVITEYNGIQHEYDSLKHGMMKAYKIRNYPGYDKTKNETNAMQSVLETENALAGYAFEKFLKPVLAITDANKNNPSKMNAADREKLMDLLLSLSFLYIEYLYLRISELSVGGNIVERIRAFTHGNQPDPQLLKKLNTESGSRALVMRMALNKASITHLSYPVFDETNLNAQ